MHTKPLAMLPDKAGTRPEQHRALLGKQPHRPRRPPRGKPKSMRRPVHRPQMSNPDFKVKSEVRPAPLRGKVKSVARGKSMPPTPCLPREAHPM